MSSPDRSARSASTPTPVPTPTPTPWRIVYFTVTPESVPLVDDFARANGHRLVAIVTTRGPRRRRTTAPLGVVQAARPGVDVLVSNHPERWAAMLAPLRPDLIICASFNWIIPADVLALPRLGAVNFHDALLPKYRGTNATAWALRNGDAEIGWTIHRMVPELDAGPILVQRSEPLLDEDDAETVMAKLFAAAPAMFQEALGRIARGDPGEPQRPEDVSYGGDFDESSRRIDWTRPAREIHNLVRGWMCVTTAPLGAVAEIDGEPVTVVKTRLLERHAASQAVSAAPGTVLERRGAMRIIQCGEGALGVIDEP